jgi:hypothetical protein
MQPFFMQRLNEMPTPSTRPDQLTALAPDEMLFDNVVVGGSDIDDARRRLNSIWSNAAARAQHKTGMSFRTETTMSVIESGRILITCIIKRTK